MCDQFGRARCHRNARRVAQVAACGADVEPVVGGEFLGDEARDRRLAPQRQNVPQCFAHAADNRRRAEGQAFCHRWNLQRAQQIVDPPPKHYRLAIGDEISPSRRGTCRILDVIC